MAGETGGAETRNGELEMETPRILVVDDELNICLNCVKILSKENDWDVGFALNGYDALKMMGEHPFDVVVTDLKMKTMGGMEVLRRVKESYPDTKVIVITGHASVSSSVEVMKIGAFDYLPKPFTPRELRAVVFQAVADMGRIKQNRSLMNRGKGMKSVSHQLIGDSPKIKKVISMVRKVAPTDSTVLLNGESGTGKELVARAVHANSARKEKAFFALDCGTLSEHLLESELFGHVRGAFTSAHKDKEGVFKRARQGTIFLDEISNINLEVQSKLLRFLETREFMPLGGSSIEKADVRLVFATNRNLQEMVAEGSFREDFYYRIFVYPIQLPPLRERRMDILPIAYHFLEQCRRRMGKSVEGFDDHAANRLMEYDWPGNVRQLRNVVERGAILCEKAQITSRDLSLLDEMGEIEQLIEYVPSTNEELKQIKKEIRLKAVSQVEKRFILGALSKNDWNVTRAAKKTGLQRTNFQNIMKKHGIKRQK